MITSFDDVIVISFVAVVTFGIVVEHPFCVVWKLSKELFGMSLFEFLVAFIRFHGEQPNIHFLPKFNMYTADKFLNNSRTKFKRN
jgi:hypothetical protein